MLGRKIITGENDLATLFPEVARQWHPILNRGILPNTVAAQSNKKYYWLCDNGHCYSSSPSNRIKGRGCPYCHNRKTLVGVNDLATVNPLLAEEWHPTKNGDLSPRDVTSGSEKKVWWRCENGHEWQAIIYNRSKGQNCPYCSNKSVLKGYNDLASTHPQIAAEWHPTKNGSLMP